MKKLTNTTKVLRYIAKHPLSKAKEVAQAVGVSVNTVYQTTYNAKKRLKNGQTVSVLAPNAQASLDLFGDKEIQKISEMARSISRGRGNVDLTRPRMMTAEMMRRDAIETLSAVRPDNVNHPAHYKVGGIETIDFIEAKSLTYNLGNVVKYITRAGVKDETKHLEDLKKGAWYLAREISNLEK